MARLFPALAFAGAVAAAGPGSSSFVANIVDYGGVGDGLTLNTAAFSSAVAAIAGNGGGTLYVPYGTFLTGPFNLTSGMTLLLDAGEIRATDAFDQFPWVEPLPSYGQGRDHTNVTWARYSPFIAGFNVSGVVITTNSSGVINGNGYLWWQAHAKGQLPCTPPHLVEFLFSTDIEIGAPAGSVPGALLLTNSPFWTVHPYVSRSVHVHDITITSHPEYGNTDGVDPDSSSDVLIERMVYMGGDDGISVKSGWDTYGIEFGVPATNVTIRDSTFTTPASCVCVGSEMSGGVENLTATNITCIGAHSGMLVKSSKGRGGYVRSFTMSDVTLVGVREALGFYLTYGDHPDAPGSWNASNVPELRGFAFSRVRGQGVVSAGSLQGLVDIPVHDVALDDVDLGPVKYGWNCTNVTGTAHDVVPPPCSELTPV